MIRRVDGYSRCTRALATRRIVATRSATSSVLICSSGVPCLTAAAAMTSSCVTAPRPVMTTLRADMIGVKYSSRPRPTNKATSRTVHDDHLQAPNRAPRNGFGVVGRLALGAALGLAAGLLDRDGAGLGLAARFAFPPGPPSRSLELRLRVGSRLRPLVAGSAVVLGSVVASGRRARRRLAVVLRLGHRRTRFGSALRREPVGPGLQAPSTISGPSIVTSPAPIVTTTSPGRTALATCSATAEKSGT